MWKNIRFGTVLDSKGNKLEDGVNLVIPSSLYNKLKSGETLVIKSDSDKSFRLSGSIKKV